jgi:porphobilinogen synthase
MIEQTQHSLRALTRLRRTPALRTLRRETRLAPADLIQPVFVVENPAQAEPIHSLPGVSRLTLDDLKRVAENTLSAGVPAVLLFGIPADKDNDGSSAAAEDGIIPEAVRAIKRHAPQLAVITDVCLCQYTTHGHCGILAESGGFDDRTLQSIARAAAAHAAAGADIVAPSGMFDGSVAAIRAELDSQGFTTTAILSYAVKYASALYGPFREAAHSAPAFGDRRSHQMDPANGREALAEAAQDIAEGADAIMVKPAGPSLDVIARLRAAIPEAVIAAYQVSGEHAMIAAAAERGWIDGPRAILESLITIKRAGADTIITYSATTAARWLRESEGVHS